MVKATASLLPQRKDLESVPGGFVEIRQMTYGEFLHRRDLSMGMSVSGDALGKGTPEKISIDALQTAVTQYEFKVCIINHNLEDDNGVKLQLGTPEGFARLDPRIGQEVSDLIDEMNQWESPKRGDGVQAGGGESDPVPEDSTTFTGIDSGNRDPESMPDISQSSF